MYGFVWSLFFLKLCGKLGRDIARVLFCIFIDSLQEIMTLVQFYYGFLSDNLNLNYNWNG